MYTFRLFSLLFLLVFTNALAGQARATNCVNPTAGTDLDVNAVRARITNGGDLWWDGNQGIYEVGDETSTPKPSAIFAGGLWIGGKDPGGGLKIAAQGLGRGVGEGRFDYFPGPLTDQGTTEDGDDCSKWDILFEVYRQEIDEYLANFDPNNTTADQVPANIAGWPANGNPLFESIHGFTFPDSPQGYAPFWDEDLDGTYNPLAGDYPLFCGDQAIWAVFNDAGNVHANSGTVNQIQAEIHLLAYAFAADDSVVNQTTFYEYRIINRAQEAIMDMYTGHWIDSDLGCFDNDRIGSLPSKEAFYVYNDAPSEPTSCIGGAVGFGDTAPVNIFQVVNTGLDDVGPDLPEPGMNSLSVTYNASVGSPNPSITSEPRNAIEYYNLLEGRFTDGTPITRTGNGYEQGGDTTLFYFDGGATSDETPWLDCTTGNAPGDIRAIYATGPYNLAPGQVNTFTLAVTTVFGVDYTDGCPDVSAISGATTQIKDLYDNRCSRSILSDVNTPQRPQEIGLEVFPNPTAGQLTFRVPAVTEIDQIEILDLTGRLITSSSGTGAETNLDLQAIGLPPGVYLYRLQTTAGEMVAGRVVLVE